MTLYLSKSRYCNAVQCEKMLWLLKNKPECFDDSTKNEAVLETGNEVGDLAMGLFGEYTEVPFGDLSEMLKITDELISKKTKIICEASFSYEGLFCSVDILKNLGRKNVELYEVKSSTSLHDVYYDDVSYQYYVLTKLGYHVKKACLVHINSHYERIGELDLNQLFTIEDLTESAIASVSVVEENIAYFREYMKHRSEPEMGIGEHCFSPYECGFFPYCTRNLPRPNVFDLSAVQLNTKLKYYDKYTCVKEKNMKSIVVITKQDGYWVLYGVGAVDAPSIFFLRERVETSFMNRIKTFCTYFFNKNKGKL